MKAGTKLTPSLLGALSASASRSSDRSTKPSSSRSHCTAAPATNAEPSSGVGGADVAEVPRDRGHETVEDAGYVGPGVGEDERPGAVGRLDRAGLEAGLTEERGLLVAQHAGDRHARQLGQRAALTSPNVAHEATTRREHRRRDAEEIGHRRATSRASRGPSAMVREALEGSVTKTPPSTPPREPPQQPRVDGRERGVDMVVERAVIEQPPHLGRREVGVQDQPGRRAHERSRDRASASSAQYVGGASVLPHEGARARPRPVTRSKATVVSRWLVMPRATTRSPFARARRGDVAQGRDRPGARSRRGRARPRRGGEVLGQLAVGDVDDPRADPSKATARTPVVPASRARRSSTGVEASDGWPAQSRPVDWARERVCQK